MNFFEKIVYMLQTEMEEAQAYGWFHLMCIAITIVAIVMLLRKKNDEKHLKNILGGYGIVALILEVAKQIVWSFNYDEITNVVTWDYQWYAAPFQLCTTPIFVSIICVFLKERQITKCFAFIYGICNNIGFIYDYNNTR